MILKLLGLNEVDGEGKLAKIQKGNNTYLILIPKDKMGPNEMKYVQKEVDKYEQQLTSGRV